MREYVFTHALGDDEEVEATAEIIWEDGGIGPYEFGGGRDVDSFREPVIDLAYYRDASGEKVIITDLPSREAETILERAADDGEGEE